MILGHITQGQAESCKGGVQKEGGVKAAKTQHEGGMGGHENHHRLRKKGLQLCGGGCCESNSA